MQLLAELGHFVHIPAHSIDDKSKASILQKALVIIQVSRMGDPVHCERL